MNRLKILILAFAYNPTCRNWVYGLKSLGYEVTLLVWGQQFLTPEALQNWGFAAGDIPIFQMQAALPDLTAQAIVESLGGAPDLLFSWEGALILKPLEQVRQIFPKAKIIQSACTFPNATTILTEFRMHQRYRKSASNIDGWIFYSDTMQTSFCQKIPAAQGKPYLVMVDPFLDAAYAKPNSPLTIPQLNRIDYSPHIVYTGRASKLWSSFSLDGRRDALGRFFKHLSNRGVHIFVSPKADTKGLPNLHHYPDFSNQDIYEGRFAEYLSQFDAHLVMYNECCGTLRRWVSNGLSTRFACALTATSPLAVTETSQFVHDLWQERPFGFTFRNVDDLVASLHDQQKLATLRQNMEKVHRSYAFESQAPQIIQFIEKIAGKTEPVVSD